MLVFLPRLYYVSAYTMSQLSGFTIPRADLNRAYIRLLPWGLVGLVAPPLLGITSLSTATETAAFLAIFLGVVYWYTLRHKWVYLTSSGIQGITATGSKIIIPWSENVQLGSRVAFNGIACISVQPISKDVALMLPLSLAATSEFKVTLEHVAPDTHPLRNVNGNAR